MVCMTSRVYAGSLGRVVEGLGRSGDEQIWGGVEQPHRSMTMYTIVEVDQVNCNVEDSVSKYRDFLCKLYEKSSSFHSVQHQDEGLASY